MKHYTQSKINWVGVITALTGILGLTSQLDLSAETMKWILFIVGALTVVLRTFFSGETLTVKKPEGDM